MPSRCKREQKRGMSADWSAVEVQKGTEMQNECRLECRPSAKENRNAKLVPLDSKREFKREIPEMAVGEFA